MTEPLEINHNKHAHLQIKIAMSGAAETTHLTDADLKLCEDIGREVVRQGAVLVTGATTGVPLWAAKGAKLEGGVSVGLSPADSERGHVGLYKLPLEYMDFIIYTGFGYVGRDILLTRTSDAVIIGPGRIGTIHEFTVAFEDNKPIGILTGPWATDDIIMEIIEKSHRKNDDKKIVFDSDPKALVKKIISLVEVDKAESRNIAPIKEFDVNSLSGSTL